VERNGEHSQGGDSARSDLFKHGKLNLSLASGYSTTYCGDKRRDSPHRFTYLRHCKIGSVRSVTNVNKMRQNNFLRYDCCVKEIKTLPSRSRYQAERSSRVFGEWLPRNMTLLKAEPQIGSQTCDRRNMQAAKGGTPSQGHAQKRLTKK